MDCIPVVSLKPLLTHAMTAARVPAETQQQVLQEADDLSYSDGVVVLVQTNSTSVDAVVAGDSLNGRGAMQKFSFPPNSTNSLEEFKGAQNEDRAVSVVFKAVAGVNQIIHLLVYGGVADPPSNKRKP